MATSKGARRLRALITQSRLAERLGVSRQAVASWLRGATVPSPERMAEIERLYGIPMREWVELDGEEADNA